MGKMESWKNENFEISIFEKKNFIDLKIAVITIFGKTMFDEKVRKSGIPASVDQHGFIWTKILPVGNKMEVPPVPQAC